MKDAARRLDRLEQALRANADTLTVSIDLSRLSDDQLERLYELSMKVRDGQSLTSDEEAECIAMDIREAVYA